MANVELKTKILLRNDVASNWAIANPILLKGEIGIERDTNKLKIGDGVKSWTQLPYFGGEVKLDGTSIAYTTDGKIGMAGIDGAGVGYTPIADGDGGIVWVKPSETTVEGLSATVNALDARVGVAEGAIATQRQDITDINTKISDLEDADILINTELAKKVSTTDLEDYVKISVAENTYAKKSELNNKADTSVVDDINTRVVNIEDSYIKSITYEDGGIFKITKQDGSTSTVDLAIEKVVANFVYNEETQSLELTLADSTIQSIPLTAFIKAYKGSSTADIVTSVSGNTIEAVLTSEVKANIAQGGQALTQVGTLSNKVDGLETKINTNTSAIGSLVKDAQDMTGASLKGDDNIVVIPTASANFLGLVRGSKENNGISVASNGKMTVNNIDANKIIQTEGDELILNGGNASKTAV